MSDNPLRADALRERIEDLIDDYLIKHQGKDAQLSYTDQLAEQIAALITPPPSLASVVAEIDGLFKMATDGPWATENGDSVVQVHNADGICFATVSSVQYWERFSDEDGANAALIVALVNNWPSIRTALTISGTDDQTWPDDLVTDDMDDAEFFGALNDYALKRESEGASKVTIGLKLFRALLTISGTGWRDDWIKTTDRLPEKPGVKAYEYVDCLIVVKGEVIQRPWNCEHLCWDDVHYDDFEFHPTEPTHWTPLPDAPQPKTEEG